MKFSYFAKIPKENNIFRKNYCKYCKISFYYKKGYFMHLRHKSHISNYKHKNYKILKF